MKKMRADYVPSVYDVFYKGEYVTTLNSRLLEQQDAISNLESIKELHVKRLVLEDLMKELNPKTQKKILKDSFCEWKENQQALQDAWHFPRNDNFIRFWDVPHCTCPKMDNNDNYPHGYYSVSEDCPVHGGFDSHLTEEA